MNSGRALTLLRVGSCRFTAYYWSMWCVGTAIAGVSGRAYVAWTAAAFGFWFLYCLSVEILNRVADEDEDRINRAERTALCDTIGYRRLAFLSRAGWTAVTALAIVGVAVEPSLPLAIFLALNIVIGIGYSAGPHLKRYPRLSQIVLAAPLCLPLCAGAAIGGDWTVYNGGLALVAVLAAFVVGLAGIKDITDIAGDRAVGFASVWTRLAGSPRKATRLSAIVLAPLATTGVLVGVGALPGRMLWLAVAAPVTVAVVLAAVRASSGAEREAAREVMYNYQLLFACAAAVLLVGTMPVLLTVLLALAWWVLGSGRLHWNSGLTPARLAVWRRLLAGGGATPTTIQKGGV